MICTRIASYLDEINELAVSTKCDVKFFFSVLNL